MSLEQYNQMALAQNGVCAICKKENSNGIKLSVDHNHKTGKVRGLLCQRCNFVIGEISDTGGGTQHNHTADAHTHTIGVSHNHGVTIT